MKKKIIYIVVGVAVLIGLYLLGRTVFEPQIPSILTEEDIASVEEKLIVAKNQLIEAKEEGDDRKAFDAYMAIGSQERLLANYYRSIKAYNSAELHNVDGLPHPFTGIYGTASAAEKWSKALWALDEAISRDDQNSDYWLWKLEILEEQTGSSEDEINAEYKKAIETLINPNRVVLVYAGFLERIGKTEEAVMTLQALVDSGFNTEFVSSEIDRLSSN